MSGWRARLLRLLLVLAIGAPGPIGIASQASSTVWAAPETPDCELPCTDPAGTCLVMGVAANGVSPPGARPPVSCQPLVVLVLPSLPASPGTIALDRGELPPGAMARIDAMAGPRVIYVEYGAALLEWETGAPPPEIRRGLIETGGEATAASDADHTALSVRRWDWLALGAGFPHTLTGQGAEPSRFLTVAIASVAEPSPSVARDLSDDAVWTSLATGTFPLLPPVPALLAMGRVAYDAGAADEKLTRNIGPLMTVVESGTFGYLTAGGVSTVIRADSDEPVHVVPGSEVVLQPGDAVVEQPGTISGLRNTDTTRSFVLMLSLSPTLRDADGTGS